MQATQSVEVFVIICAWCDRVLNNKPITNSCRQTHTICQECLDKLRQELKTTSQKPNAKPQAIMLK
jgi:hypothetical protein